jgi:hypothetical protein
MVTVPADWMRRRYGHFAPAPTRRYGHLRLDFASVAINGGATVAIMD